MKASKFLGSVIAAVQFAGVVALALGVHTMVNVSGSAFSEGGQEIRPRMGDPVVIPLTLYPRNDGFLEAKLTVSLSLMVGGDSILATDSAAVTLPPGGSGTVELELSVPASQFQQHMGSSHVAWVVKVQATTLFDLISFSNTLTAEGGA